MRRLLLVVVALVALGAPLTAQAASASVAEKAKPAAWAKTVCTSVQDWLGKVEAAAGRAASAAPTKPAAAKKTLTKVVNDTLGATKKLVGRLQKAGVPSVKGGSEVARTVVEGYKQLIRTIAEAKRTVGTVSTKSASDFVASARAVEDALESAFEHVQAAFNAATNLDVAPLVAAFNAEPACQKVNA